MPRHRYGVTVTAAGWPFDRAQIADPRDLTETIRHFEVLRRLDLLGQQPAAHLVLAVTGRQLCGAVPGHDHAVRIGRNDEVAGAFDDAGEMHLHAPDLLAEPEL